MSSEDLTHGSVFKMLVKYAAPMIITSLFQSVYSIVDIMIAGRYIGGSGISAISNGSLIMNLITQTAIGITVGGNVLISQYYGSRQEENQRQAVGTLFAASLILSVIFGQTPANIPKRPGPGRGCGLCTVLLLRYGFYIRL